MSTEVKKKTPGQNEYSADDGVFQSGFMEKEEAIRRLREKGFRITRQRKVLIDIILSRACDCCKEVFFWPGR